MKILLLAHSDSPIFIKHFLDEAHKRPRVKIAHYPIRTSDLTIRIHTEYEWHALPLSQAGYAKMSSKSI